MWRLSRPLTSTDSCRLATTSTSSVIDWLRSAVAKTPAGVYLMEKFDSLKRRRQDDGRRRVTNDELRRLNRKIVSHTHTRTHTLSLSDSVDFS